LIIIFLCNLSSKTTIASSHRQNHTNSTPGDQALSLPLISMEPATRVHNITTEGMEFTIMETLRASMVEMWLHAVKQRFLDAEPIKCVGLDCEFTTPRDKLHQCAAVLQLSVASEVLVFQICWADHVPQLLRDFLGDPTIRFCGVAIGNDVRML
jgi:hypothetical protein